MDLEILKVGNTPTEPNKVILSFLGEYYLAGSLIDLGYHLVDKKKLENHNVPYEAYDNIGKYTLVQDGFQTLSFEPEMVKLLEPIYKYSAELSPNTPGPSDEDEKIQECIDILQEWIKNKYSELTGETDITCVCSRHLIMRVAGCNKKSCHIPGNPLMHLDYISFDKAYERQCEEQEHQPIPVKCPKIDKLIDVINVWFPSKMVKDWPLGFINIQNVEIKDYIPIELVTGSKACSMRYKEEVSVIYKNDMKQPEVHMFRSATKDESKKGVLHGSFRITDKDIQRHSIELRCCIFKNPPSPALPPRSKLGGWRSVKKRKLGKRTRKKRTTRRKSIIKKRKYKKK
jgi:hypothetical protein